jgi:hypothetical protein
MIEQFPVIITVRDRLTPLLALLHWLKSVGQREIWLCDNASTYPPIVEFLKTTEHKVMYNNFNLGHRAPWLSGLVPDLGHDRHFIVSDPDVVPTDECPKDVLQVFKRALNEHSEFDKVGFSLKIDDLPDHFRHKDNVVLWEGQFWTDRFSKRFYRAPIDTTFAMYRPGLGHENGKSLRSAPPFEARHTPWYQDSRHPTEEEAYYAQHADSLISNWNERTLPANVRAKLRVLRRQQQDGSRKRTR